MKMNQDNYKFKWLLFFILGSFIFNPNQSFSKENKPSIKEELFLCVDRNVYCVDEFVNFKLYNISKDEIKEVDWSQVINIEIVTPEGVSVARGKFPFNQNGASGNIYLSENILSGNYYIRAYTKWMRNQSDYTYFYESIKIINPLTTKILNPTIINDSKKLISTDTLYSQTSNIFKVNQNNFKVNEIANLEISCLSNEINFDNICVSLVKKGTIKEGSVIFNSIKSQTKEFTFLPEFKGVSISGRVLNKIDSISIPYAKVWITMQSKETITKEVMSDKEGEFTIHLGEEFGNFNIFLYPNINNAKLNPIIQVDNDFAYSNLMLPFIPFKINNDENEVVKGMIVNSQINRVYNPFVDQIDSSNFQIDSVNFFYGKPNFSLEFDRFINLPTLSDYFKELVPMVKIKKDKKHTYFQISGVYPELSIFDPLVLVDLVKIGNIEDILSISPTLFDRIEIIELPYLRGEISYGGIIHFISKEGDFAKIKFPDESIFVSYDMLKPNTNLSYAESLKYHIPTLRNTLYWNSCLNIEGGNGVDIQFNTGSEPGNYQLKIEGITKEDIPFISVTEIMVK